MRRAHLQVKARGLAELGKRFVDLASRRQNRTEVVVSRGTVGCVSDGQPIFALGRSEVPGNCEASAQRKVRLPVLGVKLDGPFGLPPGIRHPAGIHVQHRKLRRWDRALRIGLGGLDEVTLGIGVGIPRAIQQRKVQVHRVGVRRQRKDLFVEGDSF